MWIANVSPEDVHTHRDDLGFPEMIIDKPVPSLLTAAFEHDIQSASIAELVRELLDLTSDPDGPLTFQGNSCSVTITQHTVSIRNEISDDDDESVEMSINQYRILLDAWVAHLSTSLS